MQVFEAAAAGGAAGVPQILSMSGPKSGHAIRAYRYDRNAAHPSCAKLGVARCNLMWIADPNYPYRPSEAASPDTRAMAVSSGGAPVQSGYTAQRPPLVVAVPAIKCACRCWLARHS